MSTPVPGQRAGQHPMRAAVASQRAVGRLVNDNSNMTAVLITNVGGTWYRQTVDANGKEHREEIPAP